MADIMLVLLIIFMITTPLLQKGITVNLPKGRNVMEMPEPKTARPWSSAWTGPCGSTLATCRRTLPTSKMV